MKKYSLTEEHRAQLKPWADKWIANAMSTKPMDETERAICRDAVKRLYQSANLEPPKHIVFVPSPFVLRFAAGFAAAIWHLRKNRNQSAESATSAATRDAATYAATDAATRAATYATSAATSAATYDATYATSATSDAAATYTDATYAATDAATSDATDAATYDDKNWYYVNGNCASVTHQFGLGNFGLECAQKVWRCYQGGNFWPGWDAFITFFRHVVKLPIDYSKYDAWEQLALHSSVRIVHPEFCMISDRPERLLVDNQNRPHCEDGPFCRWRDGSALYAVHGVRVPMWIVENKKAITLEKIEAEPNVEVKRVMIGFYGAARYAKSMTQVSSDDWGTLYRKDHQDLTVCVLKVINSTPEADGSFKDYYLRINHTLYGGRAGKEPRAAVASTWRKPDGSLAFDTPEEYDPCIQT